MRQTFTTEYRQVTKHRKRCRVCDRLIQDGQLATFWKVTRKHDTSNFIQGRGRWVNKVAWMPFHSTCYNQMVKDQEQNWI